MKFYLGTHQVEWLERTDVPLFISRRRLLKRRRLPRASGPWALDSGGFSEIKLHRHWFGTPAKRFVRQVRRIIDAVGRPDFAAPQDWMCEADMLERSGLTLQMHQHLTLCNYLELQQLAPEVPWCPVLQGSSVVDYWRHADAYARAGVELAGLPVVGVGSVCRRQAMHTASGILYTLAEGYGLRNLHGFGLKLKGLSMAAWLSNVYGYCYLASADSLAWSYHARRRPPLPGCEHASCRNCLRYALRWREKALAAAIPPPVPPPPPRDPSLFDGLPGWDARVA
jgi:hypothetical protein